MGSGQSGATSDSGNRAPGAGHKAPHLILGVHVQVRRGLRSGVIARCRLGGVGRRVARVEEGRKARRHSANLLVPAKCKQREFETGYQPVSGGEVRARVTEEETEL